MKKYSMYFFSLLILIFCLSTVCLGMGQVMTVDKAYKAIEKSNGKTCFVIGSFTLLHKMDRSLIDPKIVAGIRSSENGEERYHTCSFETTMDMVNLETKKKYFIDFKPINGSSPEYYDVQKVLAQNTANPYWVLELPAGTYEMDTVTCNLHLETGYASGNWNGSIYEAPVSRLLKQKITINAQANQIIYLGDYQALFSTYIYLDGNHFCPFRQFEMNLNNKFDITQDALLNGANDQIKAKINHFQIVSAL